MKESTRKALVAATEAARNQASETTITEESWKYHADRRWVALDPKLEYIFVAEIGDEDRLYVFKGCVHFSLSETPRKKDPTVAEKKLEKKKRK